MHFVEKKKNFNKIELKAKMQNPTYCFRERNLVPQLLELQINSKTVMSWSSQKKKTAFFVPFILSERNFFKICVLF